MVRTLCWKTARIERGLRLFRSGKGRGHRIGIIGLRATQPCGIQLPNRALCYEERDLAKLHMTRLKKLGLGENLLLLDRWYPSKQFLSILWILGFPLSCAYAQNGIWMQMPSIGMVGLPYIRMAARRIAGVKRVTFQKYGRNIANGNVLKAKEKLTNS